MTRVAVEVTSENLQQFKQAVESYGYVVSDPVALLVELFSRQMECPHLYVGQLDLSDLTQLETVNGHKVAERIDMRFINASKV